MLLYLVHSVADSETTSPGAFDSPGGKGPPRRAVAFLKYPCAKRDTRLWSLDSAVCPGTSVGTSKVSKEIFAKEGFAVDGLYILVRPPLLPLVDNGLPRGVMDGQRVAEGLTNILAVLSQDSNVSNSQ